VKEGRGKSPKTLNSLSLGTGGSTFSSDGVGGGKRTEGELVSERDVDFQGAKKKQLREHSD